MIKDIFNLLLITGAIYGVLFNIVTLSFFPKRKITKSILFLNLLVLSISLNNIQAWLIAKGYISSSFYIKHLEVPWYLFIVPAFYNFLIYYLKIEKFYKNYILTFFGLFALEFILRSGIIIYCYKYSKPEEIIYTYTQYEELINVLFSIFLFWKCFKIIFKETHNYQFALSFDDFIWLKYFMSLGAIVMSFWVLAVMTNLFINVPQDYMYYPLRLGSSILLYYIGFQGFLRYNLRVDRVQLRNEISILEKSVEIKKPIIPAQKSAVYNKFIEHLQTESLFLNPNLSIEDCAKSMSISISQLSKNINSNDTYNFADLINLHRVNYAKSLLRNPDFNQYTILSIGLESGFNSKSAFYSAFKKLSGQTPTDYKKNKLDIPFKI